MVGSTVVKYNEIIIRTDEDYLHHPKMLSAILEINPDAVVLSKLSDSEIVDCNKEFLKQTGYSREEVIGNKILDLNLLSREEYINYVDEIREKKTLSHFEVMVRRKDGSFIYALNSAKIIMFNDIQMVLNIAHDITGYKTVEANKQMLANLVESSEDAVITKSISGIIKSWNKGAEQIYGYLPEDVIGKHISILAPKHLKDEISELIEKVKQGKKVRHHETIRLKKDGKLINVSVTLSPISDTSGNTVGISTIARDISELKRREEKLESTMNDLKRSNKELQQFAYVSSHDLQEPIRMVTLYSQLLEKRYKDRLDDDANDFIEFIVDGAYRMKHLIDDLLVYSRVTSQIKEFE